MMEITFIICALIIQSVIFLIVAHFKDVEWSKEKESWKIERQQLLDRIQAPSFAEYTNKVIREKKVEKEQEEKPIEFIS